uniref:Putative secreted protein n=1 Tax=Anopheles darlingi TaxID=43151 RepID=A0A2M4D654_ANODA
MMIFPRSVFLCVCVLDHLLMLLLPVFLSLPWKQAFFIPALVARAQESIRSGVVALSRGCMSRSESEIRRNAWMGSLWWDGVTSRCPQVCMQRKESHESGLGVWPKAGAT